MGDLWIENAVAAAAPVEQLYSRRDAAAIGMRPRPGAAPAENREWKYGVYPLFRHEDLVPKKVIVKQEPVEVDLLASVFTANRTAKRYRDSASRYFHGAQYGFATHSRHVKERMYHLKDVGITHAYRQGLLRATGTHGPLTMYEGGGYRFHSLLHPVGVEVPVLSEETLLVEAKPKGKREVRLKDAIFTLENLPGLDTTGFVRKRFPPRPDPRSVYREDDFEDEQEDECSTE